MMQPSWKSVPEGCALDVVDRLLDQITILKDAGLTDWMML
jgi:hypothetical protein